MLGNKLTPETIEKLRQRCSVNKYALGNKLSPENKEKIRQRMIGNKLTLGKHPSEETRKKIGLAGTGQKNGRWNGGRVNNLGYIMIWKPNHYFRTSRGYVNEHRLVWEQHNNAILLPWADVHHINGNKQDNRIENLDAMMKGDHSRITQSMYNKFWIPKQLCIELGITSENIIENLELINRSKHAQNYQREQKDKKRLTPYVQQQRLDDYTISLAI